MYKVTTRAQILNAELFYFSCCLGSVFVSQNKTADKKCSAFEKSFWYISSLCLWTYIHSGDDYLVTYFFYRLLANQGKYFYFIRISWAAVLLLAMLVKCLMLCLYVLSFTTVWLKTWLLWSPLLKILKKYICFLSDLFWLDLPKSLAKISQRPENRKDWSKLLMWYCR